jgi:hypothetical protein
MITALNRAFIQGVPGGTINFLGVHKSVILSKEVYDLFHCADE